MGSKLATPSVHRVDVIIYPGFKTLEAAGLISVFTYANRHLQRRDVSKLYDVQLVASSLGAVPSDTSIVLHPTRVMQLDSLPNTAMIVGAYNVAGAMKSAREVVAWCRVSVPKIGRVAALCSGSFILAESGLLDHRRVATHWSLTQTMKDEYPAIDVQPDALFVRDGDIWTSAGVTSAIDLALAFVEQDHGREVAFEVSRDLVVFLRRSGGQPQFSVSLASQMTPSDSIRDIQAWMLENLQHKISIEDMADRMSTSVRHFSRMFLAETKRSPGQFVEAARSEYARRLLEESDLPLKAIAFKCGFSSDEQMRKVFKRRCGVTPRQYRESLE